MFSAEHFNEWFKTLYDGYGGYPGSAKGIFLRTDKLSESIFTDYFKYYNYNSTFDEKYNFKQIILDDWFSKRI